MTLDMDLIGVAGSRQMLDTPALLVELAALKRNIARMAECAASRGIALRPHAKSHKSTEIARLQLEAGAIGVSCATLGEAEIMLRAGIHGVLVTSPVVGTRKIRRLIEWAGKAGPGQLMVVADHPDNVEALATAAAGLGHRLPVLVDYHSGYHRTGVANAAAAVALARQIAQSDTLSFGGLQAYGGNIQHLGNHHEREQAAAQLRDTVAEIVAAIEGAGLEVAIVTGVGTGTQEFDSVGHVFTEMQPGSYLFMDSDYLKVLTEPSRAAPFETSLFVQSTVVSVNAPDWVTVDAGIKSLATDSGKPTVARGIAGPSIYEFFGDEHGKLIVDAAHRPELGERIEFTTSHCDPTVNLHRRYHVVDGDTLVAIWPIGA
jgi:D-serine deaminase-like pyridoxal phosphate-dependent protein